MSVTQFGTGMLLATAIYTAVLERGTLDLSMFAMDEQIELSVSLCLQMVDRSLAMGEFYIVPYATFQDAPFAVITKLLSQFEDRT